METYGVLIPAYQAADAVGSVVAQCLARGCVAGVIVVDDGSTDDTALHAERAGAHVVRHAANRGKGAALLTGFAEASARHWDAVITLDADGQHDPASVPDFIARHADTGADIVIGTRRRRGTDMPLLRRLSNKVSSLVVSRIAGARVLDSQSGYRLISRRAWESITLTTQRYDLESELLIRAGWRGFRIEHVPIMTRYGDEVSHFRPWTDTARMARMFWTLYIREREHSDD